MGLFKKFKDRTARKEKESQGIVTNKFGQEIIVPTYEVRSDGQKSSNYLKAVTQPRMGELTRQMRDAGFNPARGRQVKLDRDTGEFYISGRTEPAGEIDMRCEEKLLNMAIMHLKM